jgi:hypothetical protein
MGKNIQRRSSPNKGRVSPPRTQTTNSYDFPKKESQNLETTKTVAPIDTPTTFQDDLLTPEVLLSSFQARKNAGQNNTTTNQPQTQAQVKAINILDLLAKKENLDKIASGVSQAFDSTPQTKQDDQRFQSPPRKLSNSKSKPTNNSPPQTPKNNHSNGERFAGLSSSPAPSNLPQPSFHFLDQELRKEENVRFPNSTPIHIHNRNTNQRSQVQSPPTNPHLDTLTSNLKMMLNIPVRS